MKVALEVRGRQTLGVAVDIGLAAGSSRAPEDLVEGLRTGREVADTVAAAGIALAEGTVPAGDTGLGEGIARVADIGPEEEDIVLAGDAVPGEGNNPAAAEDSGLVAEAHRTAVGPEAAAADLDSRTVVGRAAVGGLL